MGKVFLNELFTKTTVCNYVERTGEGSKRVVMPDENGVYLLARVMTFFDEFIKDKVNNDVYEKYKKDITNELFIEGDRNYDGMLKNFRDNVASFHNTMDTNPHVIDLCTERYPIIGFNSPLDESYTCMTNVYAHDVLHTEWKIGEMFQVGMFHGTIAKVTQEDKFQWKLKVDWNQEDIEKYKSSLAEESKNGQKSEGDE